MSKLGAVLASYKKPGQPDKEFAKECGLPASTLSRILDGQISVASPRQWRRVFAKFSGSPERQQALITAQVRDYLGDEVGKFVEIRWRGGAGVEKLDLPLDEFERALADLRRRGKDAPEIRTTVIGFAAVAARATR